MGREIRRFEERLFDGTRAEEECYEIASRDEQRHEVVVESTERFGHHHLSCLKLSIGYL